MSKNPTVFDSLVPDDPDVLDVGSRAIVAGALVESGLFLLLVAHEVLRDTL